MDKGLLTLPNALGVLRFLLGFVLLALAWQGEPTAFIAVLIRAFLLGAVDGPIARYHRQDSVQGSRLDSVADFTVYTALLIGAFYLWPEIIRRELAYVLLAAAAILLPVLAGLIKFRTFTSYHTWLVKVATVCIAPASILLLAGGPAWPFHIACFISALAGVEEILITMTLDRPRANVAHLFRVWKPHGPRPG